MRGEDPRLAGQRVGGALEIALHDTRLALLPDRAAFWSQRSTLIVADAHFGKDDVFRRAGIALPRGPAIHDLQRLMRLVQQTRCERLLVLGDFLHAATAPGDGFLHAFGVWRRQHAALDITVIAGNHDRHESALRWQDALEWRSEPLVESPFVFAHEPAPRAAGYVLAGHLHPAVRLPDGRRGSLRVPVFWQRAEALVLPSFGSLTGAAVIQPAASDRVYVAGPRRVVALATAAL